MTLPSDVAPRPTTVTAPGRATRIWREHQALLGRWVARARREPLAILALVAQPMVWLVLFSNLFAQMAEAAEVPGGDYLAFMTAGAVVMTVFNATIHGGVELLFDRESGLLLRMFAAPVSRVSIVTSRFIYLIALTSLQGAILLAAAAALGVEMAAGLVSIAASVAVGALFGAGAAQLADLRHRRGPRAGPGGVAARTPGASRRGTRRVRRPVRRPGNGRPASRAAVTDGGRRRPRRPRNAALRFTRSSRTHPRRRRSAATAARR
jgi:hypothetical protein